MESLKTKTITLPSGITLEIQKVDAFDIAKAAGILPDNFSLANLEEEAQKMSFGEKVVTLGELNKSLELNLEKFNEDPASEIRTKNLLLIMSVVNPFVVLKEEWETEEGEMSVNQLSEEDINYALAEIINFSQIKIINQGGE